MNPKFTLFLLNRHPRLWLSLLLILGFAKSLYAQTSLSTGNLVFVGYNTSDDQVNGNVSNEKFSFVLLKDVAAGTKIYFTDYGWLTGGGFQKKWVAGPENGGSGTGSKTDAIISWTASTSVAAGTQIVIRPKYQMGANIGTVVCEEAVAETRPGQSYCMDLSDGGSEQLFAYQASSARGANPTVLAGMMIQGAWSSSLTNAEYTPSKSTLPASLTANNVNAALNTYSTSFSKNFRALSIYNCQTNTGFPRTIRNAVNSATITSTVSVTSSNPTNWTIPNEGTACEGYYYDPSDPCYPGGVPPAAFNLPINCTFTVYELKIVSQPVSRTVCSYQSATFSVAAQVTTVPVAQDANTTYKWQSSTDGTNWTDLSNSGVYSGVTSTTLSIASTAGLNNTRYRAIAEEPIEPSSVASTTALLTVNEPPQNLALAASGPITCIATSIKLTASSTTGGTTYAFSGPAGAINTSPGTSTISTSQEGGYSILATTPQGCTASAGTTVIKDITPPANVGLTVSGPITCTATSVTLTATASATSAIGYAFKGQQGSIPANGNQAIVSQEGTYTVTATASFNGCSATAVTGVTSNTAPPTATLAASNTLSCAQPTVTLTAGTGQDYSYVFRGPGGVVPSTGNEAVVAAAGTYTVVVTGPNGCTASTTTTVTGTTTSQSVSLTASSPISCVTPTVTLTATPIVGATYVFSAGATQIGGSGGNTATVSQAGTYTVTVTGTNNCPGMATVAVTGSSTPQSVSLTASSPISCTAPTVTLTATQLAGATYVFGAGATQIGGSGGNTATVSQAGMYSVTVTNASSCTGSASVMVSSDPLPSAPNLTSQTVVQGSPDVVLTAGNCSGTLNWTGPNNTSGTGSITVPTATTGSFVYSATCVVNGCSSPPTTVTVTVTETTPPSTAFRLLTPSYNCATGEITFKTAGGNGSLVEFQANNVTKGWTTDATHVIPAKFRDKDITIQARQRQISPNKGYLVVELVFNPAQYCSPTRLGAEQPTTELNVRVLGNPIQGNQINVEITGADGQPLQLQLTSSSGKPLRIVQVDRASSVERQTLMVDSQPAGVLLLQVSTPTHRKTLKIVQGN
ncbi:hypothetical protein [Nibrella viscosa]